MEPLVIYAPGSGTTERVARAVGKGFGTAGTCVVASIDHVTPTAVWDADLVVIGGPAHVHGMTHALRRFLRQTVESAWQGLPVVAFDIRVRGEAGTAGSAAVRVARKLRTGGAVVDVPPESFFVAGMTGPLEDGSWSEPRNGAASWRRWWCRTAGRPEEERGPISPGLRPRTGGDHLAPARLDN